MTKVSIVGSTGYAGQELVRLLSRHQKVVIKHLVSRSYVGQPYREIYGNYQNIIEDNCVDNDLQKIAEDSDLIFFALPHGLASQQVNADLLKKVKVIDLGADYRLHDMNIYTEWYKTEHGSPDLLPQAVYGLPELHKDKIASSRLVANPGCYTTCSILSLYPLVREKLIDTDSIIIDAKSGVTGAGRSLSVDQLYCEVNENVKAYKLASHRHTPEIEQELSLCHQENIRLSFTPHLIPMNRGILATCYATLIKTISENELYDIYRAFYNEAPFVRIRNKDLPQTRYVKGSNYCDISLKIDERTGRVIVVGALDNMVKGAAGQAVQNMNLMYNFKEEEGLELIPPMPI